MYKLLDILKESIDKEYTIYCDMDGVLVDFDKGYVEITGVENKSKNVNEFWSLLHDKLKEKNMSEEDFWATLPKMEGCDELWSIISPYNPFILTSPSRNPESRSGKTKWIQNNLSPQPQDIYFRYSGNKHDILQGKTEEEISNSILVDDFYKNIKPWKEVGAKAIYYTSPSSGISQLNKLGI